MRSRVGALIAGSVLAACVGVLVVDQVIADRRSAADDRLVKDLQREVKSEAILAPKLAVEKKRITDGRLSRKSRDAVVIWVLIGAAAAFLVCANETGPPLRRPRVPRKSPA